MLTSADEVWKTYRAHSSGRELWVFARQPDGWVAVWWTTTDVNE